MEYSGVFVHEGIKRDIELIYNLVRQSAPILYFLRSLDITDLNIQFNTFTYNNKFLQIFYLGNFFDTLPYTEKDSKYTPSEVLRKKAKSLSVIYSWAMIFCSLNLEIDENRLKNCSKEYKLNTKEEYERFVELMTKSISSDSIGSFIKKVLSNILKYDASEKSIMKDIVNETKNFELTNNIEEDSMIEIELQCGHRVDKAYLIQYMLLGNSSKSNSMNTSTFVHYTTKKLN